MSKEYKLAKSVVVNYREIKQYISEYRCPRCKTIIIGGGISENVTRFNCQHCKSPLIVSEHAYNPNFEKLKGKV